MLRIRPWAPSTAFGVIAALAPSWSFGQTTTSTQAASTSTIAEPPPQKEEVSRPPDDEDTAGEGSVEEVVVLGVVKRSARGLGDIRVKRELLVASPRAQTSEMLSAAPGFFVDHEDGEGLGNDIFLRGFRLEHGSGIEMRLGSIPLNIPTHIHGQGYADANFIIPEVVKSIRVLEGPYDPRQGDAAIVGSAQFNLGVTERGYQLKTAYGSFGQARIVGIVAPKNAAEDTFAAFSFRKTDGFGKNRDGQSASAMAQYAMDFGPRDRLRLLGTAYGAKASFAGVVRTDDVQAGRIGYFDSYPYYSEGQGIQSSRVIVAADFDHETTDGQWFEFEPWLMLTNFRARQNFAGALETSQIDPTVSGLGDLFQTTNLESAVGLVSRYHTLPKRIGGAVEVAIDPGADIRFGKTGQSKSLLNPANLTEWDHRLDAHLTTLDAGGYVDLQIRIFERLRLSGGLRADLLAVSVDDRLANVVPAGSAPPGALPGALREALGVAVSPRVTVEYELIPSLTAQASYGEGFRSLDAAHLKDGASRPYSKVRSGEVGLRAEAFETRLSATLLAFVTEVGNELVFEAVSGGLTTQNASLRRGIVGSLLLKPFDWLLASAALSATTATFETGILGVAHYVPNIPPALFRIDLSARGQVMKLGDEPLSGRIGLGYTFLAGRHLTDAVISGSDHILNAGAAVRYGPVELGVDAYNLLDLHYPDEAQVYASNWGFVPGQQPVSIATHITAAPPLTLLGVLTLYF